MILEHLGHLPLLGGHVTSLNQGLSSLGLKTLGTRLLFCCFRVFYFPFPLRGQDFLLFERITCIGSNRHQENAECIEIRFSKFIYL